MYSEGEQWGGGEQIKIKPFLIQLEDLKSFFGNFPYMNEAKTLQQLSTLELSLEAQPGARAKLFMKLHTSYFYDPVRERVNLIHYLVIG